MLKPTERGRVEMHSREVIKRVGTQLVQDKKAAILNENENLTSKNIAGNDLLTAVIRANMATDLRESERMTDEEMMGQIGAILLAG